MVGSLLKKANLSTPHRPSTCAAIFFFCCWRRLALARWIVKASLPEVNQFTGNCFRVVCIVLKITFLELRYPGQRPKCPSLSYYGSWFRWTSYMSISKEKKLSPMFECWTADRVWIWFLFLTTWKLSHLIKTKFIENEKKVLEKKTSEKKRKEKKKKRETCPRRDLNLRL